MQAVSAKTNVPFLHKPRNDMKLGRFCLENGRFLPYAAFLRGAAPHRFSNGSSSFFKRFVPIVSKLFCFPAKPADFVIARRARAPDAAIFDGTICHPGTRHGKACAMIYSRWLYNG